MTYETNLFADEHAIAFFEGREGYGILPGMDYCGGCPVPLLTLAEAERFLLPLIQLRQLCPGADADGDEEEKEKEVEEDARNEAQTVEIQGLIRAFTTWKDAQFEQGPVSYWTETPAGDVQPFVLELQDYGNFDDDFRLCFLLRGADHQALTERVNSSEGDLWELAGLDGGEFWTRGRLEEDEEETEMRFDMAEKA